MKVKELIEELKNCDPEREVLIAAFHKNHEGEFIEDSLSGNDIFLVPEGVDEETVLIQGEVICGGGKYEKLADEYHEKEE